jgi:ABC-type dipeptide/oligopeptide/nickel transport system permease subunit
MLSTGRNYITRAPWMLIEPGLAIFVTVMAFNVFGDGVRDLLDPRQRQRTL